jgi:Tfp pilus assembly protein FimT
LELLIVIVVVSILAKLTINNVNSTVYDQLTSTANLISGELAYARSLAVGNNSSYRFDIDTAGNRLVMRYTGGDPTLATLPSSPFRSPSDPPDQYIVALNSVPRLGMPVSLLGAQATGTTTTSITSVEFGPYGATTQANPSVIWLTAGSGNGQRYIPLTINPVTGLCTVGTYTAALPSGYASAATITVGS